MCVGKGREGGRGWHNLYLNKIKAHTHRNQHTHQHQHQQGEDTAARVAWTRLAWTTARLELGLAAPAPSSSSPLLNDPERRRRGLHTLLCLAEGRYAAAPKAAKGKKGKGGSKGAYIRVCVRVCLCELKDGRSHLHLQMLGFAILTLLLHLLLTLPFPPFLPQHPKPQQARPRRRRRQHSRTKTKTPPPSSSRHSSSPPSGSCAGARRWTPPSRRNSPPSPSPRLLHGRVPSSSPLGYEYGLNHQPSALLCDI